MKMPKPPNAFERAFGALVTFDQSDWFKNGSKKFVSWVKWLFPRLFITYVLWNFPLISTVVAIVLVWGFVSETLPRPWE